jgi:signal transduction histidine kinase
MATLAYNRLVSLVESSETINKNNDFVLKLEEVISYLKDAETGARGYLLTSDTSFLKPHKLAGMQVMSLLLDLRKEALKIDEQIPYIDSLQRMAKYKIDITWSIVHSIKVNQAKSLTEKQKVMIVDGKMVMDSIRQTVLNLKNLEKNRLKYSKDAQREFAKSSPRFLLIIIIIAISILVITMWGIYKQILLLNTAKGNLEDKIKELDSANRELDQYAFTLTHHLQEPLRKIRMFSSKLENRLKKLTHTEGGDDIASIQKISHLAANSQYLLDEFLAFAKLNHNNKEHTEIVDVSSIIENIWDDKVTLVDISKAEYSINGDSKIVGYKKSLSLLFEQLIDNSLKFKHLERSPHVHFEFQQTLIKDKPYHVITVTDNAMGFEQEYAEKVFLIFQKLNPTFGGLGVGLAISRKIVELHKGSIAVESVIEKGTTFTIKIPIENSIN